MKRALLHASCACAAVLSAVAAADEVSLAAREGVVLLTNGQLIAGTIIAAGDRYDVHLASGEISIRRADVAMVCRDAAECYAHKRSGIEPGRAQDHVELAEWCIKNHLLEAAETELAAAKAADARHPRIRLAEARLALARETPPSRPAEKTKANTADKSAEKTPATGAAKKPLDETRNLPTGTMESFTHTIQPMLVNYCAKGGCHAGRAAGGFHLERVHPKLSTRFTTERNLRGVLALVDRDNPLQSKLLQTPIRPHGPAAAAVFTDRDRLQYKQLVSWVISVSGARRQAAPPTLAERTAPLLQAVPGASGEQPGGSVDAAVAGAEQPLDGSRIPASSGETALTRDQIRALGIEQATISNVRRGADAVEDLVPKDPFDPEIFNRRFFGR